MSEQRPAPIPFRTPYTLLITSASRPHLLRPTVESLLRRVDSLPQRVVIHNDVPSSTVHPDEVDDAVLDAYRVVFGTADHNWPHTVLYHASPPRRLGPAVAWLVDRAQTEYALYSQDDFVAVRPVPVQQALDVMAIHRLHHVRFNKRATMRFKETWAGMWEKEERTFVVLGQGNTPYNLSFTQTLTVSDHWYFQLGLWRLAEIRHALTFWQLTPARAAQFAHAEPETLINHYFDTVRYGGDPLNAQSRALHQRTFIWGPIGEDRYIRHIGGEPSDWAGDHARSGAVDSSAQAWAEIATYPGPHPTPPRP